MQVFGIGTETPIGRMYGVNVGYIDGLSEQQLAELPITSVDSMHNRFASSEYHLHLQTLQQRLMQ